MIELDLRWALLLYTAVVAAVILGIWIYTEFTVYRPQRFLGKQYLWRCTFCGYSYLDDRDDTLSQCPRCGSYNAAEDRHARLVPPPKKMATVTTVEEPSPPRKNPSLRKRPHQRRRGPRKH